MLTAAYSWTLPNCHPLDGFADGTTTCYDLASQKQKPSMSEEKHLPVPQEKSTELEIEGEPKTGESERPQDAIVAQRSDCWNRAINAFGTGEIFRRRSQKYTKRIQLLTFLGIVVPILVGAVVLSFGTNFTYLGEVLAFAGIISIIQLVVSAWALVANWTENLQYSLESSTDNFALSLKFKDLGQNPPTDFATRVAVLQTKDESRQDMDNKRNISNEELRRGHRAGLRQFERPCKGCKIVPISMEPSNCDVCGKFQRWSI